MKNILKMGKTTPYYGILMETGTWPMRERVEFKMLLFYHNLVNSDDQIVSKMILMEQKTNNIQKSFNSKCEQIANLIDIKLKDAEIKNMEME